jgi:hypothetical protein
MRCRMRTSCGFFEYVSSRNLRQTISKPWLFTLHQHIVILRWVRNLILGYEIKYLCWQPKYKHTLWVQRGYNVGAGVRFFDTNPRFFTHHQSIVFLYYVENLKSNSDIKYFGYQYMRCIVSAKWVQSECKVSAKYMFSYSEIVLYILAG